MKDNRLGNAKGNDFRLDSYRMINQFRDFFEYCEKNGVELQKEDKAFIKEKIIGITRDIKLARKILYNYYTVYRGAMENEPEAVRKQNSGRWAANQDLLKLVKNS